VVGKCSAGGLVDAAKETGETGEGDAEYVGRVRGFGGLLWSAVVAGDRTVVGRSSDRRERRRRTEWRGRQGSEQGKGLGNFLGERGRGKPACV